MRTSLRKRYLDKLTRRTRTWDAGQLAAPAVVIAPNLEEQALGCGATIAAKRAAGAAVQVVFLTARTAGPGMPPAESERQLRRHEALGIAQILGVRSEDVYFLDFPVGSLGRERPAAAAALRQILGRHKPRQAFVPFAGDSTQDHVAAGRIFYDAADALEHPLEVYEYPVWFWSRWPWSPDPAAKSWKKVLAHTRDAARISWAIRFQLRAYAAPPAAQEAKRRALAERPAQAGPNVAPPADDGHFVRHFLEGFEVFHRRTL